MNIAVGSNLPFLVQFPSEPVWSHRQRCLPLIEVSYCQPVFKREDKKQFGFFLFLFKNKATLSTHMQDTWSVMTAEFPLGSLALR